MMISLCLLAVARPVCFLLFLSVFCFVFVLVCSVSFFFAAGLFCCLFCSRPVWCLFFFGLARFCSCRRFARLSVFWCLGCSAVRVVSACFVSVFPVGLFPVVFLASASSHSGLCVLEVSAGSQTSLSLVQGLCHCDLVPNDL